MRDLVNRRRLIRSSVSHCAYDLCTTSLLFWFTDLLATFGSLSAPFEMASTALPSREALQRNLTVDSLVSSSCTSPADSPFGSPQRSPSSTSLSSFEAEDLPKTKQTKLLDTYGNEFKLPDYTIKQIRDAIPAHCFERSGSTGLLYVARDTVFLAVTFYFFYTYVTLQNFPHIGFRAALWTIYTFLQGLFATGLWVLAHECGHQSFSPSKTLNDSVGWVLHSALMVPYFSWKISHGKHHKATGHVQKDMVFVPATREQYSSRFGKLAHEVAELVEETPIYTAFTLIQQQLGGWPTYLLSNITGHNFHDRQSEGKGKGKTNGFMKGVNHFHPSSPLYERKDEHLILLSDLGLAITAVVLLFVGRTYGWNNLLVWYILPYLWVNHWLGKFAFFSCDRDDRS